jgi:hypothetical protein
MKSPAVSFHLVDAGKMHDITEQDNVRCGLLALWDKKLSDVARRRAWSLNLVQLSTTTIRCLFRGLY